MIQMSVSGQADLTRVVKALREAGNKGLKANLRKGVKRATVPALRDVQQAARSIPVTGARGGGAKDRKLLHRLRYKRAPKGGFGLRNTIARATRADIKLAGEARVTIRTFGRYLPPNQRNLPRYLDRAKGWRHPRFGDREQWYDQFGKPWFSSTLVKHGPKVRREIQHAMLETAIQITRG